MKKILFTGWILFVFCFSGIGQVDSAAVVREVDSLIQVSRVFTNTREFGKAIETAAAAENLALEKWGKESAIYGKVCFNYGRVMFFKQEYNSSEKWYLEAMRVQEMAIGKGNADYAATLNNLANLYQETGNYGKAEPLYLEALAIRESVLGKESPDFGGTLNNLASLYQNIGNYEKAKALQFESLAIQERVLGKEHPDYAGSLENVAKLYWRMGSFEEAEPFYLEARALKEKAFGKEHPRYLQSLNLLGILYSNLGRYEEAELLYQDVLLTLKKLPEKERTLYGATLNNLAVLYLKMGNYLDAERLFLESKTSLENSLGKEHPNYAQCLNSLAGLYWKMDDYKKCEALFLEAKEILEKKSGSKNADYGLLLSNLGSVYWRIGDHKNAEAFQIEAKNILEQNVGKEHPYYANCLKNLADLSLQTGGYDHAKSLYLETRYIREKAFGNKHPEYVKSLDDLAALSWKTGDFDSAISLFSEIHDIEKLQLVQSARHLSERELSAYATIFYNKLYKSLSFARAQSKITDLCFDNILFHKGFLLNAATQLNQLARLDSASAEYYNQIKSYRRLLAAEYTKPIAKRKNVAELEEKANSLEKELVRTVSGFGEALRQVTWPEVQAALQPGEAAIEFIRFNYYNPKPTDSVLYAVLLLKPGMSQPAFITLFEEKQLDALLASLAGQGSTGLNGLYGGKAGQTLYRLLWAPLEPQLKGVKTVYFSPAGLLHRLNLAAIPTGKPKETLGKRYALSMLGSTRQLVVPPAPAATNATAAIFGGIRYDMDSIAIAAREPEQISGSRGLSFSQTDSTLRGGSWKYLKYSDQEAGNIQAQLQKAGFQATSQKGYAATEEAFKQLGKDAPSPRILHVSTHGFFFPDPQTTDANRSPLGGGAEPVFKISDHPMIRSGLILAGANHAWTTGRPLGSREDGILTAYEISQMDLRHTELVVLSACETGLGDIRGNEGVYGLQRAFKIAGARNLIMSLWQVPDFQTQELMTVFYQKWLGEKMTVRQALTAAQEEMQRRRYEPFYWAGFVLVE